MTDLLLSMDSALFTFLNGTLGNPLFDVVMPVITDLNRHWYGWVLIGGAWVLLIVRGGRVGRTAALLVIPVIVISDQVSSSLLKKLIMRPRPCHAIGGLPVEEHIRLLVDCGGGFSFPSSHAVNNFAAAMLLSHFYPRRRMALFFVAGIVAFSRISVGVHYPSDVLGGMLVGMLVAAVCILGWMLVVAYYPGLDPLAPPDAKDLPGPPR